MDIWEKMYLKAKDEFHPEEVSPFIQAHHVVAAIESAKTGTIYTGFCIGGKLCKWHMKIEIWK